MEFGEGTMEFGASSCNVGSTVSTTGWSPAVVPSVPWNHIVSVVSSTPWSPADAPSTSVLSGSWAPIPASWASSQVRDVSTPGIATSSLAPELTISPSLEFATEAMTSKPLRTDNVDFGSDGSNKQEATIQGKYTDCVLKGEKEPGGNEIPESLVESDLLWDAGLERNDSNFLSHKLTDKNNGYFDNWVYDVIDDDDSEDDDVPCSLCDSSDDEDGESKSTKAWEERQRLRL